VKNTRNLVGILAALVLVAGGLYGIQQINAGENCTAATTAKAATQTGDAKVETANTTSTSAGCCAAKAGTASAEHACPGMTGTASADHAACAAKTGATSAEHAACAAKTGTASAEQVKAGTQCTYNAKTANVQCTGGTEAKAEVMTAEATMGKLAHCGIDCRKVDAQVLAAKLAETKCCNYTQEQWLTMVKSAQALDAKQADAIFATATSEKPCTGEACPMTKVAKDMAAAQGEEKKETTN